jgi:hypothetical protein
MHIKELCVTLVIYQESLHDAWSTKCKKKVGYSLFNMQQYKQSSSLVYLLVYLYRCMLNTLYRTYRYNRLPKVQPSGLKHGEDTNN